MPGHTPITPEMLGPSASWKGQVTLSVSWCGCCTAAHHLTPALEDDLAPAGTSHSAFSQEDPGSIPRGVLGPCSLPGVPSKLLECCRCSYASLKVRIRRHTLWEAFPSHRLHFHSNLLIYFSVTSPLLSVSLLVYPLYVVIVGNCPMAFPHISLGLHCGLFIYIFSA